jgi:hypothetical protein
VLTLVLLGARAGVALLVAAEEARADASLGLPVHVEAGSDERCAPGHDPFACSHCRTALTRYALGARASAPAGFARAHTPAPEPLRAVKAQSTPSGPRARAPPETTPPRPA